MDKNNFDYIYLSNGSKVKCKALDNQNFQKLLKNFGGRLNERYTKEYNIQVYELTNNEVLVQDSGHYTLYFNLQDLDSVLLDTQNRSIAQEILYNKNPYGDYFPNKVDSLINVLTNELNISTEEVSSHTLIAVDEKIDLLQNPNEFREKYFINIIALVGAVFIKEYNGVWNMVLSDDQVTWNPNVKIKDHEIVFITYLYEDIFLNNDTDKPLMEAYLTMKDIAKFNLRISPHL